MYELAEALRSALESAGVDVDAVLTDGWTGSSAAEFAEGWTDVRDGGMTIMRALTAMAERLGVTAETYTSQDQSTASAMGGSSLDLP